MKKKVLTWKILKRGKWNLYLKQKGFPKQDSISYTRDKQITNKETYIEWP